MQKELIYDARDTRKRLLLHKQKKETEKAPNDLVHYTQRKFVCKIQRRQESGDNKED